MLFVIDSIVVLALYVVGVVHTLSEFVIITHLKFLQYYKLLNRQGSARVFVVH